ncbi:hypothetical protein [Fictibacillus terranigra]|uniref:Uncharacterized protein n=1 Tax=Fictibacillus terranigra TaxID=3058424 RepID=A0ABT8EBZ8_9BACL|nr:hypothetical protein [Fictibacillus sp. CENA-BCM004]MDN4075444.1 hypothetical protein [Fictibacillus sp. CENA-BCM004]
MSTIKEMRFENDKIIHVASGSVNAGKRFIEEKARRFDENNRILKEIFSKSKKK